MRNCRECLPKKKFTATSCNCENARSMESFANELSENCAFRASHRARASNQSKSDKRVRFRKAMCVWSPFACAWFTINMQSSFPFPSCYTFPSSDSQWDGKLWNAARTKVFDKQRNEAFLWAQHTANSFFIAINSSSSNNLLFSHAYVKYIPHRQGPKKKETKETLKCGWGSPGVDKLDDVPGQLVAKLPQKKHETHSQITVQVLSGYCSSVFNRHLSVDRNVFIQIE